tara:strand:- start:206 stop:439 length:234 start_codon:yes stop_codon:yes gene_type:complete
VLVRDFWSLHSMVQGYETLITDIYNRKAEYNGRATWQRPAAAAANSTQLSTAAAVSQALRNGTPTQRTLSSCDSLTP